MAQARKFGAFAGVFTPSILTILGVIMYLRLPLIVGQAGLLQTFGIIAVAHIISVATGLSVSSIATDKRVRAGGTYYIISRSLGLPMGGTLGLALFVGLSFSVSMYLVGFAESFLGFWGFSVSPASIRLTGSIMLAVVTIVTLISTALALKTQFYIMAAIGLSLVSIVLGRHEFAPVASQVRPLADAAPFIVLFGIFFPAVTGFEAGVSMSGDLKDPKRTIPVGTITAIVVGLVVYLGLAAFFAFTVDRQQLANNPNILLDMSLFPPLVVAGIWGATISSAFGSILGAPRILQATAVDGITPRWFATGYGRENEPRRALILAFLIAEAGILIGELNAIARVVSMFFITTYGFLNLTAAIESWVSPDFRPEFRVPRFVAVIGAVACFVVMIQLDFLAMLGASVLLGGLYLYLTRKQLRLETGDTWDGVWSSLARAALLRLNAGLSHRRNWRPNVLLFSGGTEARPHLVEFGRQLVGSRGLITNFDLVEETATAPVAESGQPGSPPAPEETGTAPWGVFARRVACPDVYTGVAEITEHYGFAGIEPNTVVMGWARNARDPRRFATLLQTLADRDLNILLLDYDAVRSWGQYKRVDVWWRLTGSDVSFSLALIRFLTNADEWRDAGIRFLTVNDFDSAYNASIMRDMSQVLDEHRVEADVRVIDNVVERRPFVDIIRGESIDADLTVLGLSDLREGDAVQFVADTNSIVDVLGTIVFAHASSYFDEPLVRAAAAFHAPPPESPDTEPEREPLSTIEELDFAGPQSVVEIARAVDRDLQADVAAAYDEFVHRVFEVDRAFLTDVADLASRMLDEVAEAAAGESPDAAAVTTARDRLVREAFERLEQERRQGAAGRAGLLTGFGDRLAVAVAARRHHSPETLDVVPDDGAEVKRSGLFLREPGHRVQGRELLANQLRAFAGRAHRSLLERVTAGIVRNTGIGQRWIETALATANVLGAGEPDASGAIRASVQAETIRNELVDALRESAAEEARFLESFRALAVGAVRTFASEAASPRSRRVSRETGLSETAARAGMSAVDESVDALPDAMRLLLNGTEIGLRLRIVRDRVHKETGRLRTELSRAVFEETVRRLEQLGQLLHAVRGSLDPGAAGEIEATMQYHVTADAESLLAPHRDRLLTAAADLPASLNILAAESEEALAAGQPSEVGHLTLPIDEVFEYLARTEIFAPVLEEVSRALVQVEESAEVCREVAQLAAFELRAPEETARAGMDQAGAAAIVRSGTERVEREVQRLIEGQAAFDESLRRRAEALDARLDVYSFARVAGRLQQYVRGEMGRGLLGNLTRLRLRAGQFFVENATRLAYRRSEGVLLARRLEREGGGGRGPGLRVRRLVKAVSPRAEVVEKLPTFYRQLFLGGAVVSGDATGFDAELAEAEAAVQMHRRGMSGALFILADQGHGRATLSRIAAHRHFPRRAVFRVDPTEGGSIEPRVFERRLASALRVPSSDPSGMVGGLPPGSALIINDLGLWWERSHGGNAVLDIVADLIERFSDRCFFIVNANIHAFRLLNRMRPLDDRLLALIECEPFHARELRELVLQRHGAGGLDFTIDGRLEEGLSEWRLARFFDALFDYSNGNIGAALSAWIASIRDVDEDVVHVVTPRRPSLDPLADLGPVQRMISLQLVIHDRATPGRLARVTRLDRALLARELRVLEGCGLVVRRPNGAVQIDRFARPHLVRFLEQEGLL